MICWAKDPLPGKSPISWVGFQKFNYLWRKSYFFSVKKSLLIAKAQLRRKTPNFEPDPYLRAKWPLVDKVPTYFSLFKNHQIYDWRVLFVRVGVWLCAFHRCWLFSGGIDVVLVVVSVIVLHGLDLQKVTIKYKRHN